MTNSRYRTRNGARNRSAGRPCPDSRFPRLLVACDRVGRVVCGSVITGALATTNLLVAGHTGDAVPARTASFERICAIAPAGVMSPASTAPTADPSTISKLDPDPEYQPGGS